MERWVVYAFVSMFFAGVTAVIAKQGLTGISGELGLAVRTCFIFVLVLGFAAVAVPRGEIGALTRNHLGWLALSAATTTISWVFYYKALETGEVSTVALIDKGSFLVAVLFAVLLLGEKLTLRTAGASLLILTGILIAARR
jgi:bacterial/archaeal transporter family protein